MNNTRKIADTIIALERAALDRWGAGDPSGYLEISAPDVSYFDPFLEHRLDGCEALAAWYAPLRGTIHIDRYDLIEPQVQVCGETAVLTFNLVSYSGATEMRWNCSEVYRKDREGWRLVHTHWSITQHLQNQ
ncbi:MAG: nuclear transport factor 2 family protein [Gammaproteobacteria bacterium]|nr:nuclear transport factor 2 family protein [Gammaproteobacteria bacterium]MBU1776038.1 nuclear transport factor 2 family protein [Gammaproteobacteria bacterium]MBU1969853.1 nuclear transport factor 2 family protein [Gammaproteobacteria bacterium]